MIDTASGTPVPQGPDSFAPTTQLKTAFDEEARWNTVIRVANATARNALASPELRDGIIAVQLDDHSVWLRLTGSWRPVQVLSRRQVDTTNTEVLTIIQYGVGKIQGGGAASLSEAITFPVAFASPPAVAPTYRGSRATGAMNDSGLSGSGVVWCAATTVTATGGNVYLTQPTGGTFSNINDYYYSWIAVGEVVI